jgi:Zn-dependent alcohol dehydrogenase
MPEPARGEVRVRVEACGVCHSDSFAPAWSAGGPGSASASAGLEDIAGIASRAGVAG